MYIAVANQIEIRHESTFWKFIFDSKYRERADQESHLLQHDFLNLIGKKLFHYHSTFTWVETGLLRFTYAAVDAHEWQSKVKGALMGFGWFALARYGPLVVYRHFTSASSLKSASFTSVSKGGADKWYWPKLLIDVAIWRTSVSCRQTHPLICPRSARSHCSQVGLTSATHFARSLLQEPRVFGRTRSRPSSGITPKLFLFER